MGNLQKSSNFVKKVRISSFYNKLTIKIVEPLLILGFCLLSFIGQPVFPEAHIVSQQLTMPSVPIRMFPSDLNVG